MRKDDLSSITCERHTQAPRFEWIISTIEVMQKASALVSFVSLLPAQLLIAQAGTLDNSFSVDGLISTDLGASTFDEARALAIQPDGRIVVVGTSGYSKALDFGAARYLPDGTLDNEFSFNGVDFTSVVFGDDHATSVVIQPDGKILIGGYGFCTEGNCFAMVRYVSDGSVDPEFGVDGIVTTEISGGFVYEAKAIALQDDGKILLAGGGVAGFAVVRYLDDGSVDMEFGVDGLATCAFSQGNDRANGIAVLDDGKIILSGYASGLVGDSIAVTRLNSVGAVDPGFGTGGRVRAAIPNRNTIGQAMAIGPDGEIVVVGYSVQPFAVEPTAMVARFTADGVLDSGFNGTGLRELGVIGSVSSIMNGVAVRSDGKVVACGAVTTATSDFRVVRVNSDGSDDNTFNTTGSTVTDFTGTFDRANALALQDDGRIVLVGSTNAGSQDYNFAVARYLSDGTVGTAELLTPNLALLVYPQPIATSAVLSYQLTTEDVISIDLYDARCSLVQRIIGQQRRGVGPHREAIQVDAPAGFYLLVLQGKDTLRTAKVILD